MTIQHHDELHTLFRRAIESLERRAIGAETRLEEALKRPTAAKKKSEKPHQQDLISR